MPWRFYAWEYLQLWEKSCTSRVLNQHHRNFFILSMKVPVCGNKLLAKTFSGICTVGSLNFQINFCFIFAMVLMKAFRWDSSSFEMKPIERYTIPSVAVSMNCLMSCKVNQWRSLHKISASSQFHFDKILCFTVKTTYWPGIQFTWGSSRRLSFSDFFRSTCTPPTSMTFGACQRYIQDLQTKLMQK